MGILVVVAAMWFSENAEFVQTVIDQRTDGYKWSQIECRQATEGLPAITIDMPTGKSFVCHKLVK